MTTVATPEQGQLVQVRSRRWVVNEVKPSSLPAPAMRAPVVRPQHLLTLASVEEDGLGEELQVIWEIDPGARVIEKVALPEATGLGEPEKLDAFLDAVRWGPPRRPTTRTSRRRCEATSRSRTTSSTRWSGRSRSGGDPGEVRRPAGPEVPGGRDIPDHNAVRLL